jgi:lysophospholipase L1-like esterase
MPRTFTKLVARSQDEPVRAVVLGDAVSNFMQADPLERYSTEKAWWHLFLKRIADCFYYTGGVVDTSPKKLRRGKPKPERSLIEEQAEDEDSIHRPAEPLDLHTAGPEILVENMARDGAVVLQALQALTTSAFDDDPDVVLMMYGTNDAWTGVSLKTWRETLQKCSAICKLRGVDLVIAGPPLIAMPPERVSLSLTRPYVMAAKEVAAAAGHLFADMGAAEAETTVSIDGPVAADAFERVVNHVRDLRNPGEVNDYFNPNAAGHILMSQALWKNLIDPPAAESLLVSGVFQLPQTADGDGVLEVLVARPKPGDPADIAAGMLALDRIWEPKTSLSAAEVEAKLWPADAEAKLIKDRRFRVPCARLKPEGPVSGARWDLGSGESSVLTASFFVAEGDRVRLVDVPVPQVPLAVEFPTGRLEMQSGELVLDLRVINNLSQPLSGNAEVEWGGKNQKFSNLSLAASEKKPLRLRLPLPKDSSIRHLKRVVALSFHFGGAVHTFQREIEASRSMGLDDKWQMINRAQCHADLSDQEWAAISGGPSILFKAEEHGLYLVMELPPADPNRSKTEPSAKIDVTVDARGPESRGRLGFCDHIQLDVPWNDGRFNVRPTREALFGDGYDRPLDDKFFLASLTTQPTGKRMVRLSIPRKYFYNHKWSLGTSGQNSLGVNVQVSLLDITPEHPNGWFPLDKSYGISVPGMGRNDPLGLAVLELTSRPSGKWSARIY